MPPLWIDLHTHSTASDGTDSPAALARKAAQCGLRAFALTDHDTIAGLDAAEEAAKEHGVQCIRGCELAAAWQGRELHFVGYYLPRNNPELTAALEVSRGGRALRNQHIVDKLCALGMELTLAEVEALAGDGVVGRPHIAMALHAKGYVASIHDAFDKFLGIKGRAYVPRPLLSPEECIGLLCRAGATVTWAHPFLQAHTERQAFENMLALFVECGLGAIEAYHTTHNTAHIRTCLRLAKRHDLLLTGGSDYHGVRKPGVALGYAGASVRVPFTLLEAMETRRSQQGLWTLNTP